MDWGDALAETFLSEAEVFGEDVFFRGGLYKAVVGISDQIKGLEMGGYLEQQSLQIIFPKASLVGLNEKPKANEIIEARNAGYRIHSVQFLEQDYSYDLTCELIPQYIPKGLQREVLYKQPNVVSNIQVGILANKPSSVEAETETEAPSNVVAETEPQAPSQVESNIDYVDLYLIMGQSNAHGHSAISELTTAQSTDIDIGFYSSWHQNTSNATTAQRYSGYVDTMQIGKTRGDGGETTLDSDYFGIEWGFAKQIETAKAIEEEIGIIKYAVGASTIDDNALADWDVTKTDECFQGFKNSVADALPKIKAQGKTPRWKGFVWYQGESNAGNDPWDYKDKLDTLVKAIEQELGVTNLPAVFVAPADATGGDLNVNNGHVSYARSADYYNYVKISDYHSGTNNNVHLNGSDMYDAGVAVGQAMASAVNGTATEVEFEPSTNIHFWLDADEASLVTENSSTHEITSVEARAGSIDILPRSKDANAPTIIHEHNAIALRDCFTMSHDREYLETDGNVSMPTSTQDWFVVARPNGINNAQDSIWATENGRAITLIPVGGYKYTWYWNNTVVSSPQGSSSLDGELSLFCIRWNFNGSHASTWFNGTQRDSQRSVGSASNFSMVDLRFHFMAQYGATNATDGNFCEAIVSTATSSRLQIEGYLAHKWGIQNKLPSSHTYRYYAP